MWKQFWNKMIGEGQKKFEVHSRNMDIQNNSGKVFLDRNEEHLLETRGNTMLFFIIKWQRTELS